MRRDRDGFRNSETGAVSADFVVITAAVVGVGTALLMTFADGAMDTSALLNTRLEDNATPRVENRID